MSLVKNMLVFFIMVNAFLSCHAQEDLKSVDFLIGTWKIENKNVYEIWKKVNKTEFSGKSYQMNEGQTKISETLSIKIINGKIIYEATVPNQNDGRSIPFELNTRNKDLVSFENLNHDFPKKIQYKLIDNSKVMVNVFGDNDKGFSFYQVKQ